LQLAFVIAYDTMLSTVARRGRVDEAITVMAGPASSPVVTRLGCLRGVSRVTSFGLAVEIGDWTRLSGRSIGAYLGLVPTESSSGGSRSQGSITTTGRRPRAPAADRAALAGVNVVRPRCAAGGLHGDSSHAVQLPAGDRGQGGV
jgi:transposase